MTNSNADSWLQRIARRAFSLGPVVVNNLEQQYGHDQQQFSPAEYGSYAATSAPVYACANVRARNVARLPLRIYKRTPTGERVNVTSGKLYDLLKSVNPHWTFRRLLRMTELSLCLYGQAFWILETGAKSSASPMRPPQEIWWASSPRMTPVPHPTEYISGYLYDNGNGQKIRFSKEEVIWFRYDNPMDEYSGLSPLAAARLAIDTAAGAMRSNRQIFDAGFQMSGIVGPADKTQSLTRDQAEQVAQMLERRFKGADKAHRLAVLTQPIAFTPLMLTPKDAEFLGLMKWSLREVATTFGVPPELIGDKEHATFNNIESAMKSLWTDTLIPEASMLADELTEQLVKWFPLEADEVQFDLSAIETLQEDRTEVIDQATKLVAIGVPLNRVLQELAPQFLPTDQEGYPWGDVAWLPATLQPITAPSEVPLPSEVVTPVRAISAIVREVQPYANREYPERLYDSPAHKAIMDRFDRQVEPLEKQFKLVLLEYFRRLEQTVLTSLSRKAVKAPEDTARVPYQLQEWMKRLKAIGQPQISVAFEKGGIDTANTLQVGYTFDLLDPKAIDQIETRSQQFSRSVADTTYTALQAALSAGVTNGESIPELKARVQEVFGDIKAYRAEAIARTETIGAYNGGKLQGAIASGVVDTKTWLAALDSRTRAWHVEAHGQTVRVDQNFSVHGSSGPAPHQFGGASNVVNCRCTMTFEVN